MTLVVGSKGQIVIAKEIRDKIGIKPGWLALERLIGDYVEVYFIPPEHNKSLKGSLNNYVNKHIKQDKEWDALQDKTWDELAEKKINKKRQNK